MLAENKNQVIPRIRGYVCLAAGMRSSREAVGIFLFPTTVFVTKSLPLPFLHPSAFILQPFRFSASSAPSAAKSRLL